MILTVTLNPSIDYVVSVDSFSEGKINRTRAQRMLPGGKGINVSIVLKNLGIANTATGFTAGFTGKEIVRLVKQYGVDCEFIDLAEGSNRINVKLLSGRETEINGIGPVISSSALKLLYEKIDSLKEKDYLILAGSIPESLPASLYRDILTHLQERGVRTLVDASGELLKQTIPMHPFLVKPNEHELGEILGREIRTREEALAAAMELQQKGARNVLVSMGAQGAILVTESGEAYEAPAPGGKAVYTVGAGDSMVAGFLAGFLETRDYREALMTGLCAGSATACSEDLATAERVQKLREKVTVQEIG